MDTNYFIVFVTASDDNEANKISDAILKEKLCACVNITKEVSSIYWWGGKLESSSEILMIIKTRKDKIEKLIEKVKEIHSYEVPEIIAVPIIYGNEDYLNWIEVSLGE